MKLKGFILLVIATIAITSCSVDKCDILCNSGPLGLNFELLDQATGENLFTNGTFDPADIEVLDLNDANNSVPFTFISENDINIIRLGPFGWGTNIVNYTLKVGEVEIFNLILDAEEKTENCCSFVQINTLEINNADFEQNTETGIYEIMVKL
ncbi:MULTISPECIES: hypothetical protein [Aequorivita]|uniref:Uncharacterized protein n=1 Tax=Aequorivita iocasae TaxID=2803865 RepID=A0ABX7DSN3_9FLAO|nr:MULTISPECIES: hypothetical protein [Aequorivita]QQX76762.1 hypothetical protein JK629_00365 [Aequorivita iocasae]UCA56233.1 hypothetical protein LDL78_00370 [Aequorivita sp. F7]